MNTTGRKIKAILACVLLITISLVSLFYIETEINHNCTGEDCPICVSIQQAEQIVRTIGSGALSITGLVIICAVYAVLLYIGVLCAVSTPVSKKVRMNN